MVERSCVHRSECVLVIFQIFVRRLCRPGAKVFWTSSGAWPHEPHNINAAKCIEDAETCIIFLPDKSLHASTVDLHTKSEYEGFLPNALTPLQTPSFILSNSFASGFQYIVKQISIQESSAEHPLAPNMDSRTWNFHAPRHQHLHCGSYYF